MVESKKTRTAAAEVEILRRLRAHRVDLETAVVTRVTNIGPDRVDDAEYLRSLRITVTEIVDYLLARLEHGDESQPIPSAAVSQARRAVRIGIGFDTILLRYIAGHRVISEYVRAELARLNLVAGVIDHQVHRIQETILEEILAVVAEECRQEQARLAGSADQHLRGLVQNLLRGDSIDPRDLDYQLDVWHIGVAASGPKADHAVKELANTLGRKPLVVPVDSDIWWAWLGGGERTDTSAAYQVLSLPWATDVLLAIGEPHKGINGWRRTHHEAQAARLVGKRYSESVIYFSAVSLEAAVLQSDIAERILHRRFLLPLEELRPNVKETLRCYMRFDCQISNTAKALGVTRKTVTRRLRAIESAIDQPINTCLAELDIVLRLDSTSIQNGSRG